MNDVAFLQTYWPFLLPLVLIEWGLMIGALISIFRHRRYRFGNRILWVLLSVFVQPFGAILYFVLGREAS